MAPRELGNQRTLRRLSQAELSLVHNPPILALLRHHLERPVRDFQNIFITMLFVPLWGGRNLETKAMRQNQAKVDPYLLLLGISPTEERTHYRLLDVPPFEPDLDVIESGRNRRNVALRQIKDGPLLADAERIKGEIANAFQALSNPKSRELYDARLREKLRPAESQPDPDAFEDDPKFSAEVREQQIMQFREAVREVFADGIVEEHEKLYLQQLHPKLGISAEVARQIFGEIAKETQERAKQLAEQERLLKLAQQERAKKAAEQERLKNEQSTNARTQSKREPNYSQSVTTQPVSGQQRLNPSAARTN